MRIFQVRVSSDIETFGIALKKKFDLYDYTNPYLPAFFYGCYSEDDFKAILNHKSIAVIIWGGSDAMNFKFLNLFSSIARSLLAPIYHIATSSFIQEDLELANIPYIRRNIFPKDENLFHPSPLGYKVYVYASQNREDRRTFYGIDQLPLLKKLLPEVEFIEAYAHPPTFAFQDMADIYRQCAMGVRLVPHDAGSCTVVELALMGRRTVWNGFFPGAIHFKGIDDVVLAIKSELENIGNINKELALEAKKAIADRSWLYLETYTKLQHPISLNM